MISHFHKVCEFATDHRLAFVVRQGFWQFLGGTRAHDTSACREGILVGGGCENLVFHRMKSQKASGTITTSDSQPPTMIVAMTMTPVTITPRGDTGPRPVKPRRLAGAG